MTAPTTTELTDVELLLDAELLEALPCDWSRFIRARDVYTGAWVAPPACDRPAEYEVTWLMVCQHGTPMPNDIRPNLMCKTHMLELHGCRDFLCVACNCAIDGDPYHVVRAINPIQR